MVVQHNLTAMNSNRMLGLTMSSQAKSTEKLSSGYKINRAADDAAGLSISEKMRKQIRGLTQASLNAQDGISAVQTAEGALTEVHDMLQRMNELAVKAANGTNSEDDRQYIQDEIDQLVTEIDRVAETTKFNETYLLKGNAEGRVEAAQNETIAGVNAIMLAGTTAQAGDVVLGTVGIEVTDAKGLATVDVEALGKSSGAIATALDTAGNNGAITLTYSQADQSWKLAGVNVSAEELADAGITISTTKAPADNDTITLAKKLVANPNLAETGVTYDATAVAAANLAEVSVGDDVKATIKVDENGVATLEEYDDTYVPDAISLDLRGVE